MVSIAVIGEPLVELCADGKTAGLFRRQLGGDTLNMAVYLARLLGDTTSVRYVTRLGDDPLSDWIVAELAAEGIDVSAIRRMPGMVPGLSMIETDATGERSFTYWRSTSPARLMLSEADPAEQAALTADILIFSGITLAVVGEAARARLISIARERAQKGTMVVFDTNYRPTLWATVDIARGAMREALRAATLVMPSAEDLQTLRGLDALPHGQAHSVIAELTEAECVLKTGGGPVLHCHAGQHREFLLDRSGPRIDTTGAGDSFNAGFVAARLSGYDITSAIQFAHALASRVVAHRGAVIPADAMADLAFTPQTVSSLSNLT
ncbi:MAG: sugar kinase [Pseudomonadota bacterium]